jgi:FdhD protein
MSSVERTFDRHVEQAWIERVPGRTRERDELAVEEPLEIRVDGAALAVTMRTPGEVVLAAPDRARSEQQAFERTGGLHATALFEADGAMLALREDVGRHNAMDKAIGALLLAGRFPVPGAFACLSGRASFELVQKASLAGLAGLVAVGAPSTLAVELARERDMLLCGFVRGGSFNVYAGSHRLTG